MEPRKLTEMTAALLLACQTAEFEPIPRREKPQKPTPAKDRSKVKAARKQRRKGRHA